MSGLMTAVHAVAGFFVGLWKDRSRVAVSLVGAWILWFLIGERIEERDDVLCPVRIVAAGDLAQQGNGLFIHVPDDLVVLNIEPAVVSLKVVGMKEAVSRLNRALRGDMNLSPEFGGRTDGVRSGVIQIGAEFTFAKIGARTGLRLESPGTIELRVSRRGSTTVRLDGPNLAFGTPGAAEPVGPGFEVSFAPSFIDVTGPIEDITALQRSPDRLRIFAMGSPEDYADGGSLPLNKLAMVDAEGLPQVVDWLQSPDHDVVVKIRRQRSWRHVKLNNVAIDWFMPERARRSNVAADDPVKIDPPTIAVEIEVPEEYFAAGNEEDDLNRTLYLFVNLADTQPGLEANRLDVRWVGLPEGARFMPELPSVYVDWQLVDDS